MVSTRRGARLRNPTREGEDDALRALAARHAQRVRRLRRHTVAWAVGSAVIAGLWALGQWRSHGAFEHFGSHSGNPNDWNPTLLALPIGLWGLLVGIKGLRVAIERPPTEAELAQEIERTGAAAGQADTPREAALARLERVRRLRFHAAAWVLGMLVLAPLWALLEWQDNGGFEHWSGNGRPGDWEPWILYVGAGWALGVAVVALSMRARLPALRRPGTSRPTGRPTGGAGGP